MRRDIPVFMRLGATILILGLLIWTLYPLFWMNAGALKSSTELVTNVFGPPMAPTLKNLIDVWVKGDFVRFFRNSLIVSSASVILLTLISAMAAYALARKALPFSELLFSFFMIGLMVPADVLLIPVFRIMAQLNLRNSLLGLILVYLSWSPFAILVLRAYFLTLPLELADAAHIDGCSEYGVFWRIFLPLAAPALVTVAIFFFLWSWNSFIWPLVLIQDREWYTIQMGVYQYRDQYETDFSKQIAALSIAIWPPLLFYIAFRKQIQKGLTAGALKM